MSSHNSSINLKALPLLTGHQRGRSSCFMELNQCSTQTAWEAAALTEGGWAGGFYPTEDGKAGPGKIPQTHPLRDQSPATSSSGPWTNVSFPDTRTSFPNCNFRLKPAPSTHDTLRQPCGSQAFDPYRLFLNLLWSPRACPTSLARHLLAESTAHTKEGGDCPQRAEGSPGDFYVRTNLYSVSSKQLDVWEKLLRAE